MTQACETLKKKVLVARTRSQAASWPGQAIPVEPASRRVRSDGRCVAVVLVAIASYAILTYPHLV